MAEEEKREPKYTSDHLADIGVLGNAMRCLKAMRDMEEYFNTGTGRFYIDHPSMPMGFQVVVPDGTPAEGEPQKDRAFGLFLTKAPSTLENSPLALAVDADHKNAMVQALLSAARTMKWHLQDICEKSIKATYGEEEAKIFKQDCRDHTRKIFDAYTETAKEMKEKKEKAVEELNKEIEEGGSAE